MGDGEPPDGDDLPPPSPAFVAHLAAELPPGVESDVALFRVFNGPVRPFDEPTVRVTLELALSRATDPAAAANHDRAVWMDAPDLLAPLSSITAPTSIVHGDQDPVYPLAHGQAVAAAINASDPVRYVEDGEVILVFQTYLAGEFYPLRVTAVEINAGRRLLVKSACWKDKPDPEGPISATKSPWGMSSVSPCSTSTVCLPRT